MNSEGLITLIVVATFTIFGFLVGYLTACHQNTKKIDRKLIMQKFETSISDARKALNLFREAIEDFEDRYKVNIDVMRCDKDHQEEKK